MYYSKNDEVNKGKRAHTLTIMRKERPKDLSSIPRWGKSLIFSPKVSECHDSLKEIILKKSLCSGGSFPGHKAAWVCDV
jgi:hypothetical protein